jgi:hypothetical protein
MTHGTSHTGTVALGLSTSVLLLASAVVGLSAWRTIYKSETTTLVDSAAAQDLVSLGVGMLLVVLMAATVITDSLMAALMCSGILAFVAYNAAIYCFSVRFGPLFLVWTALLGLSTFGAVRAAVTVDRERLTPLIARSGTIVLAWVLIGTAAVFALLWLKEIIPDLLSGRPSTSAATWRVPTNPVHVLDLALFLPAVVLGGLLILSRNPSGLQLGVPALMWMILTCLPILLTPVMARTRGHTPDWSAVPPVSVLLLVFLVTAGIFFRTTHAN